MSVAPALRLSPPAVLALLYGGLILAGAGLLKLPAAAVTPVSWAEALFTATSSVTVTGLMVVDPGSRFTLAGQAVILALVQLGGLGVMTFATMVMLLLGLRSQLQHRIMLREDLNQTSFGDLGRLVRLIVGVVVVVELGGALLLAFRWVPDLGWRDGLWAALFHAVTAFNNAGIALWPDSLSRWVGDPLVNLVVPALYIIGSLGFTVLFEVARQRPARRWTLHTKLILTGSAALTLVAVLAFLALEWSNPRTLGALDGTADRVMAAWFQGTAARTSGFNTIPIDGLRDSTSLMVISLMLIGGGTTSTAGGIKVSTFLVLLLATLAFLRRQPQVNAFGRAIDAAEVMKVLAITCISLLIVMIGTFLLTLTHQAPFLDLAFEMASAFGTTGLSRGVTGALDGMGYAVTCAAMFIGRIGPLALSFLIAAPAHSRIRYPASRIYIG